MKQININQNETFFYEKIFSDVEKDNNGHISITIAKKYFLKSGLSLEDVEKISEYSGANRLNYFGRSQFYVALKIIALVQTGHELNKDILLNDDVSIPKFDHKLNDSDIISIDQKDEIVTKSPKRLNNQKLVSSINLENIHDKIVNNRYRNKLHSFNSPTHKADPFFIQPDVRFNQMPHGFNDNYEYNLENNADESSEEDNKGLLDPNLKRDVNDILEQQYEGNEDSNSSSNDEDKVDGLNKQTDDESDEDNSSESDDDNYAKRSYGQMLSDGDNEYDSKGYMLMEPVEGLASSPTKTDNNEDQIIPTATQDQLEYYTKCFHTLQINDGNTDQVSGADVINFLKMYPLEDDDFEKILKLTNMTSESSVNQVEFTRSIHVLTHIKKGFPIPQQLPPQLLPVSFEKPDEPFSFDLSAGEQVEGDNTTNIDNINDYMNREIDYSSSPQTPNFFMSQLDSAFAADGDNNAFVAQERNFPGKSSSGTTDLDHADIGMNRSWSHFKRRLHSHSIPNNTGNPSTLILSHSLNTGATSTEKPKPTPLTISREFTSSLVSPGPVTRPRPAPKKAYSLPQSITTPRSIVAPPPPPRTSTVVPTNPSFSSNTTTKSTHNAPSQSQTQQTDNSTVETRDIDRPISPHSSLHVSPKTMSSQTSLSSSVSSYCETRISRNYNENEQESTPILSTAEKTDLKANKKALNTGILRNRCSETMRRKLMTHIRELKSRNHVLLRLNNEMTNELEELREQRTNLALQLDYMRQSQLDIS